MRKDFVVTKSNYFIMNCSYDLSLEEQRIILILASMIQPDDEEFKAYKFKVAEFINLLGISSKTKYTEVPKIAGWLTNRVFEIKEENRIIRTPWLSSAKYEKGSGMVELKFSSALKPYMLQLKEDFTQYKLTNILSVRSKYSPRLYEILKCNEHTNQGFIEISITKLRSLLKLEHTYPLYSDFKRKVIIISKLELSKFSDISFEFEEVKTVRKVTSLRFYIHPNNKEIISEDTKKEIVDEDDKVNELCSLFKDYNIEIDILRKIILNADGDVDRIKAVYEHYKAQSLDNLIGYMLSMVKEDMFLSFKG